MPDQPKKDYLPWQMVQTFEVWRSHGGPPWGTSDELYDKYYEWANETYPFAGYGGEATNVGWSAAANGPSYVGPNVVQPAYTTEMPGANTIAPANLTPIAPWMPQQGSAYQGHGAPVFVSTLQSTPSSPSAGEKKPTVQAPATTARPFTNAQWASMTQAPWSDPRGVTVDGHTYTNQYNYIGPTTTGLTDPNAGWEQMNRYGQRLGTLGPLNNKNVMGRRRSAGNPLFNNRYGNGPAGPTQNNPTRMPPNVTPHNSDGGGTYTGGTYNDLINWRI